MNAISTLISCKQRFKLEIKLEKRGRGVGRSLNTARPGSSSKKWGNRGPGGGGGPKTGSVPECQVHNWQFRSPYPILKNGLFLAPLDGSGEPGLGAKLVLFEFL